MIRYRSRRLVSLSLATVGAAIIVAALRRFGSTLEEVAYASGWLLAGLMVFLAIYNLRKKLTYPPLLSSSIWLQLHIYVGILTLPLFFAHTGLRLPNGPFEVTLAALFAGVAISGILGLGLSRIIPARLAARGEDLIFERLPIFRRQLRERAEALVVQSVREADTTTLADLYQDRLADYFAGPRHFWRHLLHSRRPLVTTLNELEALGRYFNDAERTIAAEMADLIDAKDRLDYHHAMQGVLKGWLFVHLPLTYVLLVFVAVHAVLVYAFAGEVA